jgi:predicted nuclease of restriction endonuclease-like RecB superfamily
MSFRSTDLKKTVRKGKDGYQVTPARLEGRRPAFRIEFLLQQFEGHLGCPRRLLDPDSLLDFMGDARLGRGLLATLSQWYRLRPRTFAEVLEDGGARLQERGVSGPIDLRAWVYGRVNQGGRGYLDPEQESLFWQRQSRSLGHHRETVCRLMLLDRAEEAVLVRTGPPPSTADVMAAYNARALTTLLRSAAEISIRCRSPRLSVEGAARIWADPWSVSWRMDGDTLLLFGRADALGCWTRHGRHVERSVLELLRLPEVDACELSGRLDIGGRSCRFLWKTEDLLSLRAGSGAPLEMTLLDQIMSLAAGLRRERDRGSDTCWRIRRASNLLGVEGGVLLPHLELRHSDWSLYLRLMGPELSQQAASVLVPFQSKTPVALVTWTGGEADPITLHLAGFEPITAMPGALLAPLTDRLDELQARSTSATPSCQSSIRRAA